MRRRILAAAALALVLAAPAPAACSVALTVTAAPAEIAVRLGEPFVFETTIANPGETVTGPLIAHLNVLSLRSDVYVDPEDWSAQRTRWIGTIPAGGSLMLTWRLEAVSGGNIAAYVSVLEAAGPTSPPANSPVVQIDVASRDTLDASGILPLAVGLPAALALLAGAIRIRRGRR